MSYSVVVTREPKHGTERLSRWLLGDWSLLIIVKPIAENCWFPEVTRRTKQVGRDPRLRS